MNQKKFMLLAIILLTIGSIITILKVPTKFGLDLIGGARLVLEAQTTDNIVKITPEVMDSLQFAIEKRVNALGVSETIVQKAGDRRLIVEIPNVKDLKQAKQFLGDTAELEFKELKKDDKGQPVIGPNGEEWISTGLSGKDLRKAEIGEDQTGHCVGS